MKYLLDTHVLVSWVSGAGSLTRAQRRALGTASAEAPLGLSNISLWEVGSLYERQKLKLTLPFGEWLSRAVAAPRVRRLDVSAAVITEMVGLQLTRRWDPADRLIVATARVYGLRLITSDTRIIDSALVPVVAG